MTLAEMIYQHSLRLPEPAAREVLDFVEFLERRYGVSVQPGAAELTATQQEALARLAGARIHFGAKPVPSRDALYDDSRG